MKNFVDLKIAQIIFLTVSVFSAALADGKIPEWWEARGAGEIGSRHLSVDGRKDAMSAANVGQLKNMAVKGAEEMNEKLAGYGGAGDSVNSLRQTLLSSSIGDSNYEVANAGQLKTVAKPFFDRLYEISQTNPQLVDYNGIELISGGSQGAAQKYPWPQFPSNPTGEDYDANYEAVNTAQLKYLFSWRILTNDLLPLSSDGFPSGWYEGLDGTSQEYAAAASLVLEAVSASSVRCADNSENQIKVRVRDMRGNPVANVSVAFSLGPADGGASISATQVTTDSNGEASLIFTKGTGRMYAVTASLISDSSQKKIFSFVDEIPASTPMTTPAHEYFKYVDICPEYEVDGGGIPNIYSIATRMIEVYNYNYYYIYPDDESKFPCDGYGATSYDITYDLRRNIILNNCSVTHAFMPGFPVDDESEMSFIKSVLPGYLSLCNWSSYGEIGNVEVRQEYASLATYILNDISFIYVTEEVENGLKFYRTHTGLQNAVHGEVNHTGDGFLEDYAFSYSCMVDVGFWLYGMSVEEYKSKDIKIGKKGTRKLMIGGGVDECVVSVGNGVRVRGNVDDEWGNSALCRRDITGSMYFEIYVSDVNESGWATISFSNLRKRMIPEYYLPSEGSDNSGEEEEDNDLRGSTLLGSQGFIDINCPIPAWRIKFEGREFSMPASESSGPKYRKISLLGRPISDDKPQTESESDFSPPETFIDALTLNLRHDCVDYIQPIPNSELVLAVRRNYSQESWTLRNGLRPHERPDSPFGAGWSSNLAPSVVLELTTTNDLSSITSPSMARVTDENGMSFSFAITGTGNMRKFYPMPNSKSDAQSFLNKLYFNSDGKLIFEKKYGTRLEFENIEAIRSIPSNRFSNGYPIISYDYYRLKRVEDKYGNALIYEYQDSEYDEKLLLPSRIYYNKNPNVFICIESNYDGNVTSIYGPEGVKIAYSYDYFGHNSDNLSSYETRGLYDGFYALTSVSLMDGDTSEMLFNYAYTGVTYEKDIWHIISGGEVFSDFSHCHFDLSEITDGAGNVYEFEYAPFETNYMVSSANGAPDDVVSKGGIFSIRENVYYAQNGGARKVSKVTVRAPARAGEDAPSPLVSQFSSYSFIVPNPTPTGNVYSLASAYSSQAARNTTVTDPNGNQIRYTWVDGGNISEYGVVIEEMPSFSDAYGKGPSDPFTVPVMVYYPKMKIEYLGTAPVEGGENLYETAEFDIGAGMAVKKVRDISGNVTTFEYADELPLSSTEVKLNYASRRLEDGTYEAARYSDPTKQTDALGNVTEYVYNSSTRVMTSVKHRASGAEEYSRQTLWTLDSAGYLRIQEQVLGSDGQAEKTTLNEYADSDFPAFLTKATIVDGAGTDKDIVTEYVADASGRVAQMENAAGTRYMEYNGNGRKISETDANGNTTRYVYNALNRLVRVENPDATFRAFEYDAIGRKVSETDERGAVSRYEYDAMHNIEVSERQVSGQSYARTENKYNGMGLLERVEDPNGNAVEYGYDALGRRVWEKKYDSSGALKSTATFEYGANSGSAMFSADGFKPTRSVSGAGVVKRYEYDVLYRPLKSISEYGEDEGGEVLESVESSEFDMFGNVVKKTDPLGNITLFQYNSFDKPVSQTNPDATVKLYTYTGNGAVLSETDELGARIDYEYDLAGQLSRKTFPQVEDGHGASVRPYETYTYDANGNMICRTDARGFEYGMLYDQRNRVVEKLSPAVAVEIGGSQTYRRPTSRVEYDAAGNVVKETDANGNIKTHEYDLLGRRTKTTRHSVSCYDGTESSTVNLVDTVEYDMNGNPTIITDAGGRKMKYEYDYQNKPVKKIRNYGGTSSITELSEYDCDGRLTAVVDGKGNRTEYTYDGMNRRTLASYGVGTETTRQRPYTYNALNLTADIGTSYEYDSRNRLKKHSDTYVDENPVSYNYAYDAVGRILSVNDVSYTYDAMGRTTSETNGGYMHAYGYDENGNRVFSRYGISSDGSYTHALSAKYDSNNRLEKLTDEKGRVTTYIYDLNGNIVKQMYPNGITITNTYDSLNRLTSTTSKKPDGTTVIIGEYKYDAAGNVRYVSQVSSSHTQVVENTYDDFDRLTTENITLDDNLNDIRQKVYSYDNADNCTSYMEYRYNNVWDGNIYYYNSLNQMYSDYAYPGIKGTCIYDEFGNYISKAYEYPDESTSISSNNEYDGFGRLKVDGTTTYNYDYRGRLVSSINASNGTYRYKGSYSGGTSVIDKNSGNTTYLYRGSDMGGGVGGLLYTEDADSSGLNYKHYNLRGDIVATTDSECSILVQYLYEAFGAIIETYGISPSDRYRSNTKYRDGYINEGRRWRTTSATGFISPDPLEYIDGLNCYAYCGNNPWGRFDPYGLADEDISGIRVWGWVGYSAYSTNAGTFEQQKLWSDRAEMAADAVTIVGGTGGLKVGAKEAIKNVAKNIRKVFKEFSKKSSKKVVEKIEKKATIENIKGSKKGHKRILEPAKDRDTAHTVFTMNSDGSVNRYITFKPQSNPNNPNKWMIEKRFDRNGSHFNKKGDIGNISGPHIHEGKNVRPANLDEIPGGK